MKVKKHVKGKGLTLALLVLLALALAACGGAAEETAETAEEAAGEAMMTELGESGGAVSIVVCAGYIERGWAVPAFDGVTSFEDETGCMVSGKSAAASDEEVALMMEGGFDLVTASGDASLRLIAVGTVQPINTEQIEGWDTVDPR